MPPDVAPAALEPVLAERVRQERWATPPAVRVVPLKSELTGAVRLPLLVLTATAAAILLVGCLNLTSFVLSRVSGRAAELRVRGALGASRGRLFGELFELEPCLLRSRGADIMDAALRRHTTRCRMIRGNR